jgi:15-cis-phytoene synthase
MSHMREGMSPEVKASLEQCRWMIKKGSKSFSLAAELFDPDTRDAAFFLYGWCRYCDDRIDEAGKTENQEQLAKRVKALKENTTAAFSFAQQQEPVFVALQYIVQRYGIPAHYALELIEGMAMDARGTRYDTLKELLLYCYRVAGTVGLMMSHVMGLRDESALKHAADLGIAMQLTNIARDITEDAAMGRIYLPLSWLQEAQIPAAEVAAPEYREKLAMLSLRLLREADRYYRSGDAGLWHLSFRSACAVSAARQVYSEIGSLLLRKGARAWDQRTYVTEPLKVWVVMRGVPSLIRSVPGRLWRPWSPAPLRRVWKYSNVQ